MYNDNDKTDTFVRVRIITEELMVADCSKAIARAVCGKFSDLSITEEF